MKIGSLELGGVAIGSALAGMAIGDTKVWPVDEPEPDVPDPKYHFDWHEGSGNHTTDIMGTGAQLNGSVWVGTACGDEFVWTENPDPDGYSGPSTVAIRFRLDTIDGGYQTLLRAGKAGGGQFWIHVHNGHPDIYLSSEHAAAATVSADTDYLLTVVANAGAWTMYLNGTQILTFSDATVMIVQKYDFSVQPGPNPDVIVDDVRFWNQALTADEIAALA